MSLKKIILVARDFRSMWLLAEHIERWGYEVEKIDYRHKIIDPEEQHYYRGFVFELDRESIPVAEEIKGICDKVIVQSYFREDRIAAERLGFIPLEHGKEYFVTLQSLLE